MFGETARSLAEILAIVCFAAIILGAARRRPPKRLEAPRSISGHRYSSPQLIIRHVKGKRFKTHAAHTASKPSFRMRNDGENYIFVPLDFEVEAPTPRYPALPYIERFAIFFCAQRGMPKIAQQEPQLFAERLADRNRQVRIIPVRPLRKPKLHLPRFFAWPFARDSSEAIASLALP